MAVYPLQLNEKTTGGVCFVWTTPSYAGGIKKVYRFP